MRRGMTLIEILVTISLLGIFGSIAYPSMNTIYRGIARNEKYATQFENASEALNDISDQLRAVTALPGEAAPVMIGKDEGDAMRPMDHLRFTTSDRTQLRRGTEVTVEYFVQDPPPGHFEAAHLVKRVTDATGAVNDEQVFDKIVGLDVEYRANGQWVASWDGPGTPEAVRVTVLVVRDVGVRAKRLFTAVRLPEAGA